MEKQEPPGTQQRNLPVSASGGLPNDDGISITPLDYANYWRMTQTIAGQTDEQALKQIANNRPLGDSGALVIDVSGGKTIQPVRKRADIVVATSPGIRDNLIAVLAFDNDNLY